MKIIITGAGGQVALALAATAPRGYDVNALDRSALDLSDRSGVASVIADHRPDWVINAGAYTDVDGAEMNPDRALAVNGSGPAYLAEALRKSGGKLLQISSDYVFDGKGSEPYHPDDRPNPLSVYGQSKYLGEQAVGANGLTVRSSWIYASGGRNFVRTMVSLMQREEKLRVVADQIGTPTCAIGLSEAIWGLIAKDARGIWHHCDAGQASWFEFALAIAEDALRLGLLERSPEVVPVTSDEYPTRAKRPRFSVLDASATCELLGIQGAPWRRRLSRMLELEAAASSEAGR